MSKINWRDFFEDYISDDLSEEQRLSFKQALEEDYELRRDFELFTTVREGLEKERIRKKLKSMHMSSKGYNSKNQKSWTPYVLGFIILGMCYFAYRIVAEQSKNQSPSLESSNRKERQSVQSIDSTIPYIEPTDSKSKSTDLKNLRETPSKTTTKQPIAAISPDKTRESLVGKYLALTSTNQTITRSTTRSDFPITDEALSLLELGKYNDVIQLLSKQYEAKDIHPDDAQWFLCLAYTGIDNLEAASALLVEIEEDDFHSHHVIASDLLVELNLTKK